MNVEIWSDIACPWCYVGKRRFEAALAAFEHAGEVTVSWRSFELDPGAPPERPEDAAGHLARKYGRTREQAEQMHATMTGVAAGEGLDFRFDRLRLGNSFDAHRLVHLAAAHGIQDAMKERLMRAYLTEGEPIGDPATRRVAGAWLVATLVAIFPANVWMAQHPERYPVPGGRPTLLARLPLQAVFIAWVRAAARR